MTDKIIVPGAPEKDDITQAFRNWRNNEPISQIFFRYISAEIKKFKNEMIKYASSPQLSNEHRSRCLDITTGHLETLRLILELEPRHFEIFLEDEAAETRNDS